MPKMVRVLSIDGGGIRGIVPGRVLTALEHHIQRISGDPDARVIDYFDLVAGTSTGAILLCALLCPDPGTPMRPRYSAAEVCDLYLRRGGDIFKISLWQRIKSGGGSLDEKYSARGLEKALDDYFGDTWLSALLRPCLISAYDVQRGRTHFFTQHGAQQNPSQDFLVRDVARATSAAPTFFEVVQIRSRSGVSYPLIDGGVFANNPALCAYAEVRAGYARACNITPPARADRMMILSLGTGKLKAPYAYEEVKNWGLVNWIRPLLGIMMSGQSETVDYQLRQIYDAVGAPEQYLRVAPILDPGVVSPVLDDVSDDNLAALRELGQETFERNSDALIEFAERLVEYGPSEHAAPADQPDSPDQPQS